MSTLKLSDCKEAFAQPGETSIIDLAHPVTKLSIHSNQTLEQIRERYPGAERVDFAQWCRDLETRENPPVQWAEVTEDKYWEMLEVLPPAHMNSTGFLVGEPMDHHGQSGRPRYTAYGRWDGKHFVASRPMTRPEFIEFTQTKTA